MNMLMNVSNYLEEQLDKLVEQYDNVVVRRGKGLNAGTCSHNACYRHCK
ncbi:MAG: hypothetical protein ACLUR5_17625 [Eubacterium ventriosum]